MAIDSLGNFPGKLRMEEKWVHALICIPDCVCKICFAKKKTQNLLSVEKPFLQK